MLRSRELAGNGIADAHGEWWRRGIAFLYDIEVVIERGDFIDFRRGHLHLGGERHQMRCGQAAETILNQVEMLDEQIPAPRRVAEQLRDLPSCPRIDRSTFGHCANP